MVTLTVATPLLPGTMTAFLEEYPKAIFPLPIPAAVFCEMNLKVARSRLQIIQTTVVSKVDSKVASLPH